MIPAICLGLSGASSTAVRLSPLPGRLTGFDTGHMRSGSRVADRVADKLPLPPMVFRQKNCLVAAHADVMLRGTQVGLWGQ
jgi:hypothetical protein